MKIGIDALYIRPGKVGGTESYLRNLIKSLEEFDKDNEYYIFTSKINNESFSFRNKRFHKVLCEVNGENRFLRIMYVSIMLPKIIKKLNLDLLFFPTYVRSYFKIKGVKTISNIQDIQYKHFPQYFSFVQKTVFSIFYKVSLIKSDKIICISNFVKKDLINYFRFITPEKYQVIYNPIDFDKFNNIKCVSMEQIRNKYDLESKKYLLSVASLLPHKNLETLIAAYSLLIKNELYNDIKLVLVGVKAKSTDKLIEKIEMYGLKNHIIIPGFINDDELNTMYHDSLIFISTSTFEGFGMPPVEAMYMKLPTITTRCTSLPEVTLNKALYYDDPMDANQLEKLICNTINKPPKNEILSDISLELKERYSFKTIARHYIDIFNELSDSN